MIHKDLLGSIFGVELLRVEQINKNTIIFYWKDFAWFEKRSRINIFELSFICKEWALKQGFEIVEEFERVRVISLDQTRYTKDFNSNNYNVEKIFLACKWIFDQVKNEKCVESEKREGNLK